ncbi:MAG TPA: hypothetical protein VNV35_18020 [Puia sp.]|nr:hypothetical protein [Puia sp.]
MDSIAVFKDVGIAIIGLSNLLLERTAIRQATQLFLNQCFVEDRLVIFLLQEDCRYEGVFFGKYLIWPSNLVPLNNENGLAQAEKDVADFTRQCGLFLESSRTTKEYRVSPGSRIKVMVNSMQALITWYYNEYIPGCRGFALYRKRNQSTQAEVMTNLLSFSGLDGPARKPTTEAPLQTFVWMDLELQYGDTVSYLIVPMLGSAGQLTEDAGRSTGWTTPARISTGTRLEAWFNRGLIQLGADSRPADLPFLKKDRSLDLELVNRGSPYTKYLGGPLADRLFSFLKEAEEGLDVELFACLSELSDENVVSSFEKIGARLHLVLGYLSKNDSDRYKAIRLRLLKAKVDFSARIRGAGHAHNRFMVLCRRSYPASVWTGSTSLTLTGIFRQANNALVIHDAAIAKRYRDQWDAIRRVGNGSPANYIDRNTQKPPAIGGITTWFAPVRDAVDLAVVSRLINGAKQAVLFALFNPGNRSVINDIVERSKRSDLYIAGVVADYPTVGSVRVWTMAGGKQQAADMRYKAGDEPFLGTLRSEGSNQRMSVRSRVVVIDPLGDRPVVVTGSHGMGYFASKQNDDNLNIIEGDSALAMEYMVNILAIHNRYRFRNYKSVITPFTLSKDDSWQISQSERRERLNFLFGMKLPVITKGGARPDRPSSEPAVGGVEKPVKKKAKKKVPKKK